MKFKSYFLVALAAVFLASCAKDDNFGNNPDNPSVNGEGTMNVSLKFAAQTRANGDYEEGTANESAVKDLAIYFFDAEKMYLGKGVAPKISGRPGDGGNVEKNVYAVDVPASVVAGFYAEQNPMEEAYVVAVLNGGNFNPTLTAKTDNYAKFNAAITNKAISDIAKDGEFMMTSSNYVNAQKAEMALIKITKENVGIKSNSLTKDPVNVQLTVERVAAKVKVQKKEGADVEILGWGLNVTNKQFYPVKEVKTGFFDDNFSTKYADWGQKDSWSNLTDKRSHWAVDPNYTNGKVDATTGKSDDFNLLAWTALKEEGKVEYCFENTFTEAMQNRNSTTTAVIVAKFNPDETGDGTWVNWKQQNFSETAFVQNVVKDADGNTTKNITKWYYRVENPGAGETILGSVNVGDYLYIPLGSADFKLSYTGSEDIKFGETVIGKTSGKADVVRASSIASIDAFYTKPANSADNAEWEKTMKTYAETGIEAAITEALGADEKITVYLNGYSYYEVPLRHFEDGEVEAYEGDGAYKPEHLGRYGIVRNNYYVLTVKAITTPGKPITGEPIPTEDKDDYEHYFIDVDIEVLSWNIRNQEVEL